MLKRLLSGLVFAVACALPLLSQSSLTTVAQAVICANGSPASGSASIQMSVPGTSGSAAVVVSTVVVPFTAGNFSTALVPNETYIPANSWYSVTFTVNSCGSGATTKSPTQIWVVPASTLTLSIGAVVYSPGPLSMLPQIWRGSYSGVQVYSLNDAVSYTSLLGVTSSYVSLTNANSGNEPDISPLQWGLLAAGSYGSTGDTGPVGPAGPTGPSGAQGATGPQGVQGIIGVTGAAGGTGEPGSAGPTGPQGAQGSAGVAGATGSQGPAGPTGAQGTSGATGAAGLGYTWRGGWSGSPTSYNLNDTVFYNGSSYVNIVPGVTTAPPNSSWSLVAAVGAAGAAGVTGAAGPTGPGGPAGSTGPAGATGVVTATGCLAYNGTSFTISSPTCVSFTGSHMAGIVKYTDTGSDLEDATDGTDFTSGAMIAGGTLPAMFTGLSTNGTAAPSGQIVSSGNMVSGNELVAGSANTGVLTALYVSGGTFGAACTLTLASGFGGTGATFLSSGAPTANVTQFSSNTVGSGYTSGPTSAALSGSGCSGTAVITSTVTPGSVSLPTGNGSVVTLSAQNTGGNVSVYFPTTQDTVGQMSVYDGSGHPSYFTPAINVTLPSWLVLSAPCTSIVSCTLAIGSQTGVAQNKFLAAPCSGTGAFSARVLCAGDMPPTNLASVGANGGVTNSLGPQNGGTGSSSNTALVTGYYLRSNGLGVYVEGPIQGADVPTLNQNSTGTSGNVTGIVAPAHGGLGASNTVGIAGHYPRSNGTSYVDGGIQSADVPLLNQNTTGTAALANALVGVGSPCTGQGVITAFAANGTFTCTPLFTVGFGVASPLFSSVSSGAGNGACGYGATAVLGCYAASGGVTQMVPGFGMFGLAGDALTGYWLMTHNGSAVMRVLGSGDLVSGPSFGTATNCASGASPAVCGAAASGAVAIPTGTTSVTLVVNNSIVTASSRVFVQVDQSSTIAGVTCNTTLATDAVRPYVSARSPGVSFSLLYVGTISTNPVCVSYFIIN